MSYRKRINADRTDIADVQYQNKFAQIATLVSPRRLVAVLGRGSAKTTDFQVERIIDIAEDMPGAPCVWLADTFSNLTANVLPAVLEGLERKGWREGVHYIIEKTPPTFTEREKANLPDWLKPHFWKPFNRLVSYKRTIVFYTGMMEYDGDLHIPNNYLVNPPEIDRTLAEYLSVSGIRQFAISETQKYGHVTYFFNGNRSGRFENEEYQEIPSDVVPFEQRPWMKCAEITDAVVKAIEGGAYDFIRLNYPNGDMVGHTGVYQAVQVSMGALDICLERVYNAVKKAGGILVVTADHGNADDMYEHDKKGEVKRTKDGAPKRKTSHSLNPGPCFIFDPESKGEYSPVLNTGLGISSIATTCMELLGFVPPADYDKSIVNMAK